MSELLEKILTPTLAAASVKISKALDSLWNSSAGKKCKKMVNHIISNIS